MARQRSGSASFDLSEISRHAIRPRQLHTFSVHYSAANRWVATINVSDRHADEVLGFPGRHTCFSFTFESEFEAKRFAKSYAPPRMVPVSSNDAFPCCFVCKVRFPRKSTGSSSRRFLFQNCRNCGVAVCRSCCVAWSQRMIPKTYLMNESPHSVRVCKSCDWLGNAFCIALLRGRLDDAKALHATGNVNLRSTYPDIRGEAMFPVHCAVIGGNLDILRWLVDTHGCPIRVERTSAVQQLNQQSQQQYKFVMTSNGRSVLDVALAGKHKIDILRYLVVEKNMRVQDAKNPKQALEALDVLLRQPSSSPCSDVHMRSSSPVHELPVRVESDDMSSTVDDAARSVTKRQLTASYFRVVIRCVVLTVVATWTVAQCARCSALFLESSAIECSLVTRLGEETVD
eukprot:CAMPEP_0197435478 /NCGR_PEP_ID=MMETSP1175-20131217/3058_1 /TAXON_ID=1003142 /ORGANISM="Triceratium dubium, Strain CCMP147" /LENGTH=399 /DNA_ID=CAMNT_0042964523 /DNA_START=100 /DNA_END=1300 /DNA_ORIENTATION=+